MKLGDVTVNHDGRRIPVREADRKPGPYPYYGASGVVDHVEGYLFEGLYLLIAEDGENLRTRRTPVAFLADGRFWVNNHAHIVTGNERADTRFLCYALAVTDIGGYLTGSAMPKLTQRAMNAIEVPLPPIDTQRAIADVLGALDDKIEHNRRTAQALERLARAVFKAWFVDFEPVKAKADGATAFPGMPQSVFNDLPAEFQNSELGPIPKGWGAKPLSKMCSILSGGTPRRSEARYWGGDIPWYSVRDAPADGQVWVTSTRESITNDGLINSAAQIVPKGCTILSARGTVGELALAARPLTFNQSCYGLLPIDERSHAWLHLLLQSAVVQLLQHTHGSVFDTITRSTFDRVVRPVPPGDLVRSFEDLITPSFALILASVKECAKLAEMRDHLLPKLLTGAVRVAT